MRVLRPFLAGVFAVAAFAGTPAAQATCVTTQQQGGVCVVVNRGALPKVNVNGSSYDDCVEIDRECVLPIHVPIPTVTPGQGELVTVACGGPSWTCNF
jgi:hypothetical protein